MFLWVEWLTRTFLGTRNLEKKQIQYVFSTRWHDILRNICGVRLRLYKCLSPFMFQASVEKVTRKPLPDAASTEAPPTITRLASEYKNCVVWLLIALVCITTDRCLISLFLAALFVAFLYTHFSIFFRLFFLQWSPAPYLSLISYSVLFCAHSSSEFLLSGSPPLFHTIFILLSFLFSLNPPLAFLFFYTVSVFTCRTLTAITYNGSLFL